MWPEHGTADVAQFRPTLTCIVSDAELNGALIVLNLTREEMAMLIADHSGRAFEMHVNPAVLNGPSETAGKLRVGGSVYRPSKRKQE
jgi:hypothetical protein